MAEVGVGVDAGDDQVRGVDQSEQGQSHAVRRRSIGREGRRAIGEFGLADAQRAIQRLDMARDGPVVIGRKDRDAAKLAHFLGQRQQPRGPNAIVVGNENVHADLSQRRPLPRWIFPPDWRENWSLMTSFA